MAISSMTGFARAGGEDGRFQWIWEARSVNGKGQDVRLRLPSGWDRLDPIARPMAADRFKRGNLSIALEVKPLAAGTRLTVNEALLEILVARCEAAGESPRIDRLLQVRGVVESAEEEGADDPEEADARLKAIAATLAEVLDALQRAREEEGARTAAVIGDQLEEIATLTEKAAACAAKRWPTEL